MVDWEYGLGAEQHKIPTMPALLATSGSHALVLGIIDHGQMSLYERQEGCLAHRLRPQALLQSMGQAEASLAQLTSMLTAKEAQLAESQRTVRDLRETMAAEASSAAEGAAALEANLRRQVAEAQQQVEQLREKLQGKRQVCS